MAWVGIPSFRAIFMSKMIPAGWMAQRGSSFQPASASASVSDTISRTSWSKVFWSASAKL